MLRLIGLITVFVLLAKFPEGVKAGIDVGSYVAKVLWVLGKHTANGVNSFYEKEVAPEVEKAKNVKVD